MTPNPRLNRLLNLVPYLQHRREVHISEVAEHFHVTPKQVLQDLEVLQFCGLPEGYYDDLFDIDLDWVREDGHISFRNADVLRRPRKLRVDEATSLLVALEVLVAASGGSAAATSALAKLRDVLGDVPAPVKVELTPGREAVVQELTRAIDSRSVVEVEHLGRQGARRHTVEPVRLRTVDGFAYLDGWNAERADWRSYRLDRILDVEVTNRAFVPRDDVPPADRGWFDGAAELELVLDPRAAWVAEYYPVTGVEHHTDSLTVAFRMGSTTWARELLLRLGPLVRRVSDTAVAESAREAAREALAHYDAPRAADSGTPGRSG